MAETFNTAAKKFYERMLLTLGTGTGSAATGLGTNDVLLKTTDLTPVLVAISSATTTAIVSATASQTTRVHRMKLRVAGAQVLTIKDGTTNLEVFTFPAAGGNFILDFSSRPWYSTTAATALNFTTTTTATVEGLVEYVKGA